jgi:hypothetical protein
MTDESMFPVAIWRGHALRGEETIEEWICAQSSFGGYREGRAFNQEFIGISKRLGLFLAFNRESESATFEGVHISMIVPFSI